MEKQQRQPRLNQAARAHVHVTKFGFRLGSRRWCAARCCARVSLGVCVLSERGIFAHTWTRLSYVIWTGVIMVREWGSWAVVPGSPLPHQATTTATYPLLFSTWPKLELVHVQNRSTLSRRRYCLNPTKTIFQAQQGQNVMRPWPNSKPSLNERIISTRKRC